MTERRYRLGPVTIALVAEGRAVEAFVQTLEPFRVAATADATVAFDERADEDGGRTVPLPRVDGADVVGSGLRARYDAARKTLRVCRAAGTGEVANAFRWLLAEVLLDRGAILVHGCGVSAGNSGALFTGPSGAGKSTLARAAMQGGVAVLGDELVGVGGGRIFGTPWNSGGPGGARLAIMGMLGWSARPALHPMEPSELLRVATSNVLLPREDPATRLKVASLLISAIKAARSVRLDFAPRPDVADLLRAELSSR